MGTRSSRSDRICGAAIFIGGSIALAWLLTTCAMRDAGVTQELAKKPPVMSTMTPQANRVTGDDNAMRVPSGPRMQPSPYVSPQPAARAIKHEFSGHVAKAERKPTTALMTHEQVAKRLELNRTARVVSRPSVSQQAEWTGVRRSVEDDTVGQASSWLNGSALPPRSHVTTRTAVPMDTDWNARMTQRRITDDPAAFHAGAQQNSEP